MYSADSLGLLKVIAFHQEVWFRKPCSFIACCWLSVYDTIIEVQQMLDVYKLYFSAIQKAHIEESWKNVRKNQMHMLQNNNLVIKMIIIIKRKTIEEKEVGVAETGGKQRKEKERID